MKSAQFSTFGGPEVLEIVDLPDPQPAPGQIRIVVHAAGVSATDPKIRSGALNFGRPLPQTTSVKASPTSLSVTACSAFPTPALPPNWP